MKSDLLKLIEQAYDLKVILDNSSFANWKARVRFELQSIYNQTKNKFIWNTLVIINQGFLNGYSKKAFIDLRGNLNAIKENINAFYPDTDNTLQNVELNNSDNRENKITLKDILGDIIQSSAPADMLCKRIQASSIKEAGELRCILKEIERMGYIHINWADNLPYIVHLFDSAKIYYEQLLSKEEQNMSKKGTKVFISHSSKDIVYANALVELLEDIGLDQSNLFCSSTSGYNIPLDEDIYEYLKNQFNTYYLHVILLLSKNYYKSPACLNEMGAAWVLHNTYTTILLPGFSFKKIEGAVNPRRIGLKLDSDSDEVKERLGQLRSNLQQELGLKSIPDMRWEKKRDSFISIINQFTSDAYNSTNTKSISKEAMDLLRKVARAGLDGTIFITKNIDGTTIQVNDKAISSFKTQHEFEKLENCTNELLENNFIRESMIRTDSRKFEIQKSFSITQSGCKYARKYKDK